jgi:hypothetical protein
MSNKKDTPKEQHIVKQIEEKIEKQIEKHIENQQIDEITQDTSTCVCCFKSFKCIWSTTLNLIEVICKGISYICIGCSNCALGCHSCLEHIDCDDK